MNLHNAIFSQMNQMHWRAWVDKRNTSFAL